MALALTLSLPSWSARAQEASFYTAQLAPIRDYFDWSHDWQTIMLGATDDQLFFYDRVECRAKIFNIAANGALTFLQEHTDLPCYDFWVRGHFTGSAEMELVSYSMAAGLVAQWRLSTDGDLTLFDWALVGNGYNLGTSGRFGGENDDLLLYHKARGEGVYLRWNGFELAPVATRTWQKIWDRIVPLEINGDGLTDLLFYNQDSGDMKLYTIDDEHQGTLVDEQHNWPMTENGIIASGYFGGTAVKKDIVLYDQTRGELRFWYGESFGLAAGPVEGRWGTHFTQVAATRHGSDVPSQLLFYTSRRDITVTVVQLRKENGGEANSTSAGEMWRWIGTANRTYAPAGVHLVWSGEIIDYVHDALNGYQCDAAADGTLSDEAKDLAVDKFGADHGIVVYIRDGVGSSSGLGCSGPNSNFVMLPHFTSTGTFYFDHFGNSTDDLGDPAPLPTPWQAPSNLKLFSHELGHFFHLAHAHFGSSPAGTLDEADHDRDDPDYPPIFDTPPTPGGAFWNAMPGSNRCDDSPAGEINVPAQGGATLVLNPERHNVMINGVNCDLIYNFSPGQLDRIRITLLKERPYLLQ